MPTFLDGPTPSSHAAQPQALKAPQLEQFDRDGFLIARSLFSAAEMDDLRAAFMAVNKDGPVEGLSEKARFGVAYDAKDPLAFYPRIMQPHRHPDKEVGRLAKEYLLAPRIGGVLTDLMGEAPLAAQSMFYFKPPGARGQDLHQDNFYLRVRPGSCMAAWIAVDDADTDNGTLLVVPGTHRDEIYCPEKSDQSKSFTSDRVEPPAGKTEIPVLLKSGDCLFFNGSLIHGSYPNATSDRFRRAIIFHYLPSSSAELSFWYKPLLDFNGGEHAVAAAGEGGPCGRTFQGAAAALAP